MKEYLIGLFVIFALTACGGGGTAGTPSIGGGSILQPGNLIASISSVVNAGYNSVIITNTGQSPVIINKSELMHPDTADEIDPLITDCNGKTLNPRQSCKIMLHVFHNQVGNDEIDLSTNNGVYKFAIKINTTGNGLITNTTTINTPGSVPVVFYNTGALPMTIKTGSLKNSGTTDTIDTAHSDCYGKTLESNQSCMLTINVDHGEIGKNDISLTTNTGTYQFSINVNTTTNGLTTSTATIYSSGNVSVIFDNMGLLPITIKSGSIKNTNTTDSIDISHTNCYGKVLNTNQNCTVMLNVYHGEVGKDDIQLDTSTGLYSFPIAIDTEIGGLISLTNTISSGGVIPVIIKNTNELPVTINAANLHVVNTIDTLDLGLSDCMAKPLTKNQTCRLILHVALGEAGQDMLELSTSIGKYYFTSNVDTTGSGILAIDKHDINSTKPQVVNLTNKGSMPLIIKAFGLESENNTLKATDINCINKSLGVEKSCQITLQASAGQEKQHFLTVVTNNVFLKHQTLLLAEKTNVNKLAWKLGESSITSMHFSNSGSYDFTVVNTGTNDINVGGLSLNSNNIGSINTNCIGKKLQSGDICDVTVNVKTDAYGTTNLIASTPEKLVNAFNYPINVSASDLLVDDSHDIVLHPNTTRTVTIKNKGNFAIDLDSITYDTSAITFSSSCGKVVLSGGVCTGSIHALDMVTDNAHLVFHEFKGNVTEPIGVHITNGVATAFQPVGNLYYAPIPQDKWDFYQVFTVTNNSNDRQNITLTNRDDGAVTVMTKSYLPDSAFVKPNCATGTNSGIVEPNSTCEFIIREPNDLNVLKQITDDDSNPDKGNFRIQVIYKGTNDTFIHKYQGIVGEKRMHRNQTYPNGATINATVPIAINACGINPAIATTYTRTRRCDPNMMCSNWEEGLVIKADLQDANTIHATYFAGIDYSAGKTCIINADIPISLKHYASDTKYYDRDFGGGAYFSAFALAGSRCTDTSCNIRWGGGNARNDYNKDKIGLTYQGSFTRPLSAADWTIATGVSWQDLGSIADRQNN